MGTNLKKNKKIFFEKYLTVFEKEQNSGYFPTALFMQKFVMKARPVCLILPLTIYFYYLCQTHTRKTKELRNVNPVGSNPRNVTVQLTNGHLRLSKWKQKISLVSHLRHQYVIRYDEKTSMDDNKDIKILGEEHVFVLLVLSVVTRRTTSTS